MLIAKLKSSSEDEDENLKSYVNKDSTKYYDERQQTNFDYKN